MRFQKLLSIVLAVLLIAAVTPLGAFVVNAAATSGTCGENVTWSYNTSSKTLTISGSGNMNVYRESSYEGVEITTAPWRTYYKTMRTVIISSGVTSIGAYAFYNCTGPTSITIPGSVKRIGSYAFSGCKGLESLTIPYGVTTIDWHTFARCTGLTSITLPDSVSSIGEGAFSYCTGLTSITIPDSVTSIGEYAFEDCTDLNYVVMGNGVKSLGESAFCRCESLMSITIPKGVTIIEKETFSGSGLKSVIIPEGVVSINYSAFSHCMLESVIVSDGVTTINREAFSNCRNLKNVFLGNGVKTIGEKAFENCLSLTSITIPESVTSIGKYAFLECGGIKTAYIGKGVKNIGENSFYGCNLLSEVVFCGNEDEWNAIKIGSNDSLENALRQYHKASNIYETDATQHWRICEICGAKISICAHIFDNADDTDCNICGYTCEHNYDSIASDECLKSSADCTHKAVYYKSCSLCGAKSTETFEYGEKLGHDLIHHNAKAPTCTAKGWDAYDTCSRCDYTTYSEIAPLGHDYKAVVTNPTCTAQGYTTHTCSRCNDSYVDTYTEIAGHTEVIDKAVAPTCTATGLTEGKHCSVCNAVLVVQIEIPALGHDKIHHDAKAATCTEKGWNAYDTCSRCDYTTYSELTALGHDYKTVVTNPTCTEKGYTTHTCSRCKDSYVDTYVDALGHDWDDGVVTTPPTCTVNGVKTYTCKHDNSHTYTEPIKATGHTEVIDKAVEPTCTATGLTEGKHCSACGTVLVAQSVVPALGHTMVNGKCSVCGYQAEKVKFPDVSYTAWYGNSVAYAVSSGLMKGYANGKFGTSDGIQRQDFVVILARLSGDDINSYAGKSSFKDVPTNAYYAAALAWAKANGVSNGYNDGSFGVGRKVTREQIMTFLHNYAKLKGYDVTVTEAEKAQIRAQYSDFVSVSSYAQEATYWALKNGVISGKQVNGKRYISPGTQAQRCEVAAMFYNINEKGIFA